MKKSRYTEEQIIGFIKQLDGGVPAAARPARCFAQAVA